jgi:hypothetical protein
MAADHVVGELGGAAERDVLQANAALLGEYLAAEMSGRADAPAAVLDRFALFRHLGQRVQIIGGEIRCRHQQDGRRPDASDRGKILDRIVGQVGIDRRRQHMRCHAADHDRVAVRRRGGGLLRADGACGAGAVFDIDGLPETLAHPVGEQAAEHVTAATGNSILIFLEG